jgi:hypothetical protein
MTFANSSFDEVITTTLKNRSGKMADNVSNNNALLRYLRDSGNTSIEDGGETLVQELDFAENSTGKFYSGYDVLDVSATDVISAAEYDWKQYNVNVTVSGRQMRQNGGSKTRVINLVNARIKNAESTAANDISTSVYSDGTGSSGLEIGGLQLLVADAPTTGTVGGINRANFSFWQNIAFDATTDGGAAATNANIQGYMNDVHVQLIRGNDRPNLLVADSNYYTLFEESMQAIQRITRTDNADSGFETLSYKGVPVMLDQAAPTDHMYFLNTDFLFWKVHRDANFSVGEEKSAVNQDAIVKPLLFMGNLTMSNGALQGVLKD